MQTKTHERSGLSTKAYVREKVAVAWILLEARGGDPRTATAQKALEDGVPSYYGTNRGTPEQEAFEGAFERAWDEERG